jgi:hypothetical protein
MILIVFLLKNLNPFIQNLNPMKSVRFITLFLLLTSSFAFTAAPVPVKLTWETLRDVTFKKKWYAEESIYMLHPTFGPSIQKLKNQPVVITGYILPVDLDANLYVLSAFPFSACFFCGGAGPETVMTLNFKKGTRKFKTDERLTFQGTLKLNADDIYQMNYILDGAEIVD